ncbi:MAG: hypothetical protein R6X03_10480 [Methyloceanibacter sp.]|jgi:hypothetical protein
MFRRAVLGATLVCLIGGPAIAQDDAEGDNECTRQLTAVEEKVHDKVEANALSEADTEKVNLMLDEADALCTEGKFSEASATLATITKMVGN